MLPQAPQPLLPAASSLCPDLLHPIPHPAAAQHPRTNNVKSANTKAKRQEFGFSFSMQSCYSHPLETEGLKFPRRDGAHLQPPEARERSGHLCLTREAPSAPGTPSGRRAIFYTVFICAFLRLSLKALRDHALCRTAQLSSGHSLPRVPRGCPVPPHHTAPRPKENAPHGRRAGPGDRLHFAPALPPAANKGRRGEAKGALPARRATPRIPRIPRIPRLARRPPRPARPDRTHSPAAASARAGGVGCRRSSRAMPPPRARPSPHPPTASFLSLAPPPPPGGAQPAGTAWLCRRAARPR